MELSIIIVNYKSRAKLLNCLESIIGAGLSFLNYEIIVVDNDSGDDLEDLPVRYPNLRPIKSAKNSGMGGGNNLGIKNSRGEFILILNPDTVIKDRAINTLLNYLKNNPAVGIVGPKLIYPDGSLQASCARWPVFLMPFLRRTFLGDYFKNIRDRFTMNDFDHNSIREVDWLMGSCLLFRRRLMQSTGDLFEPLFDERYFMYFEDIDLCRQVWAKGFSVVYNPDAVVIHDHKRQSADHPWYFAVFLSHLAWQHIASWLKYFMKWGFKVKIKNQTGVKR
ncbi:MAG: glycosyltransferase family 2 protein [Patescibacteria group bacterium]